MITSGKTIADAFGRYEIQNNSVALSEQIKNAIDANASAINFNFVDNIDEVKITIIDNGIGMDNHTLKLEWNRIGDSSKANSYDFLGGKGVGRFTLFRLANIISIYTKTKNSNPCKILLDYDIIARQSDISKYDLPESSVSIEEWQHLSPYNQGTVIVLENIVRKINYNMIQKELINMNQPFAKEKIKINMNFPESYKKIDFLSCEKAILLAPFNIQAKFSEGRFQICTCATRDATGEILEQVELDVESLNSKLEKRILKDENDLNFTSDMLKDFDDIDIYIDNFFFKHEYKGKIEINEIEIKEKFLSAYQGINIYRDKVKIFGFGSDDFLKLAEKRLKRAGDNIDNKLSFGYVSLSNKTKNILKEQTSREGFIRDDYYNVFIHIIDIVVDSIGTYRKNNIKNIINHASDPQKQYKYISIQPKISLSVDFLSEQMIINKIEERIKSKLCTNISSKDIKITVDLSNYDQTLLNKQLIPVLIHTSDGSNIEKTCFIEVSRKKQKIEKQVSILFLSKDIYEPLRHKYEKIAKLIIELNSLNVNEFPHSCAYTLKSLIEISMNMYIKKYCNKYSSMNLEYKDEKEEIFNTKDKKYLNEGKRINALFEILNREQCNLHIDGKRKIMADGIDAINFAKHKDKTFVVPSNLIQFYNEISGILKYILNDIVM